MASLTGRGMRRHRRPVTAYYPSAGQDASPLHLLAQEHLRRLGIEMPTPEVLVCVDRDHPQEPGHDPYELEDGHRPWPPARTRGAERITVEGRPADLLTVVVGNPNRGRTARVLRIRGENADVLDLAHRARWSPMIYIAPDDGCCFGGGNMDRCENSVTFDVSPFLSFGHPPRWWITDHFSPHNEQGQHPDLADLRRWGFPFHVERLGLIDERWGHEWDPFGGATAFELTPMTEEDEP